MSLNDAPAHIKLAVDLIELLEINEVAPDVALAALAIVTRDFERKQQCAADAIKKGHGDSAPQP